MGLMQEYVDYMQKEIEKIRKRERTQIDECIADEYEERAGIMEYDACLPRCQAEALTSALIRKKYNVKYSF